MKYKGIIIDIETIEIPGSSLRELKNGTMKECKPKYEKRYSYPGGHKHTCMQDCKDSIDNIIGNLELQNCYVKEIFEEVMNDYVIR